MVKTFGKAADFTAFRVIDVIYRIAWAKTMQVERTEDGQDKESSLCDYMLERYNYRPSMDLVLSDILSSGENASMAEIKEISEGLGVEPLGYMRKAMLHYIDVYDQSPAVNGFYINGIRTWAKKDERMGFQQNIADKVALGFKEITWWFDGVPITLTCDKAEQLRLQIENYAFDCFNVTAAHRKEVAELDNIEAVLTYDYRTGYPEQLRLEV